MPIRSLRSRFALPCLIASASLLTACVNVPPVEMQDGARSRLHTVSVNPVVTLPPEILFQGKAQGMSMLLAGPLLGQAIGSGMADAPKAALLAEMKANHIELGDIVAAEFARQASAGTPMRFAVDTAPADARVDLAVNVYGISQSQAFGSTLYPVVNLSATMKTPDGKVVWQSTNLVTALNAENKEGHTFEEYQADPELLRKAFVNGSDIVSRMLAQDLGAAPKPKNPAHL